MTILEKAAHQVTMTNAHHDYARGLDARAAYKVSNRATCEYLVEDTFTKTWSYLMRGGKIDVMKAFLYHVLNNLIVDEYRKRKSISLDALLEGGYEPSAGNPERLIDILDGKSALLLIARLPIAYQKVMRMRYVHDLSISEMALATGQTKNSIAVQTHRGLEKLKVLYNRR